MWKWLCAFVLIAGGIVTVTSQQHTAREKYEAQGEKDCIKLAVSPKEQRACEKEAQERKDYAPWWYVLVAWPDGITTWAIIATGFVIAWQSNETRKAAEAAAAQIRIEKSKERARLVVGHVGMPEIDLPDRTMDNMRPLNITAYVANEGSTKALNVRAYVFVKVVDDKRGGSYEIGVQQAFPTTVGNTDGGQFPKLNVCLLARRGEEDYPSPIWTDEETFTALIDGKKFLQLSGLLTFMDLFEDSHEVPFRWIWVSQGDSNGMRWRSHSEWYNVGATKDEMKAARERQNPN